MAATLDSESLAQHSLCGECGAPMVTLRLDDGVQFLLACERCTCELLCALLEECGDCELVESNSSSGYACSVCERLHSFEQASGCVQHYADSHASDAECAPCGVGRCHQCVHCSLYFCTAMELQRHEDSHTELDEAEALLRCFSCAESFASDSALAAHRQLHAELHACTACGRRFKFASALRKHHLAHQGLTANACRYCGDSFKSADLLERHVDSCEFNYEGRAQAAGEGSLLGNAAERFLPYSHTCLTCGKTFRLAWRYRLHLEASCTKSDKLNAYSDRTCNICRKIFANPMNLHRHEMIHAGIRNYKCKLCGKSFVQKTQLDTHMNIHRGVRPFRCDLCHKSFTDRSTFHKHRRIHAKPGAHPCRVCGKVFSQAGYLRLHARVHTEQCASTKREPAPGSRYTLTVM